MLDTKKGMIENDMIIAIIMTNRPKKDFGTMSPYPTVAIVTTTMYLRVRH